MRLTTSDYHTLYTTVFNPANNYPGYRPGIIEAPAGNSEWDTGKHYAHISMKYLAAYGGLGMYHMERLLVDWTNYAKEVAINLGLPMKWWPHLDDSTIRILAYPAGTTTARHTDFDLFTLPMYRNITDTYEAELGNNPSFVNVDQFNQLHYGELMELINPVAWQATEHEVHAEPHGRTQYSAVFFAMPRLDLTLPSGLLVQEWLDDRKLRSRKEAA